MTKWILIVYCAVLFVGSALILRRYPVYPMGFVATGDLPANRLLQPGDIAPAVASGQYTRKPIGKGQPVRTDDTSAMPEIVPQPGKLPLALPVRQALVLSGTINAGAMVHLCKREKELIDKLDVRAVLCAGPDALCIAVLELPAEKAVTLAATFGTADPVTAQPSGRKCE
jgi:hypothetical protein